MRKPGIKLLISGFDFVDVVAAVKKERLSRTYATYKLLEKKFERNATPTRNVSLKMIENEVRRMRARLPQNEDSDSGFENRSSSSEPDLERRLLQASNKKTEEGSNSGETQRRYTTDPEAAQTARENLLQLASSLRSRTTRQRQIAESKQNNSTQHKSTKITRNSRQIR